MSILRAGPGRATDVGPDGCGDPILFSRRRHCRWMGVGVRPASVGRPGRIEDLISTAGGRRCVASRVATSRLAEHDPAVDGRASEAAVVGQEPESFEPHMAVSVEGSLPREPDPSNGLSVSGPCSALKGVTLGRDRRRLRLLSMPPGQQPRLFSDRSELLGGDAEPLTGVEWGIRTKGRGRAREQQGEYGYGPNDWVGGSADRAVPFLAYRSAQYGGPSGKSGATVSAWPASRSSR
jgi:hypothetical protein